ncbi:MAG TPA: hypothetical protein DCF68_16015 [Cyanothece sp. UBA12306]|nr:hypothetical protein [Cyanothece sp. UBA12306]
MEKVQILLLKNGKVVNTEYLSERIYVDNESSKGKSGTNLAGYNAFVTYQGDNFDQASNLKLYNVFNQSIQGNVTDFPVVEVTIKDGYQESQTIYDYDTGNIVISVEGIVTEYSQVTIIKGSDTPTSTPFGKTEYIFFNGLSVGGLGLKDFKGIPPYYYTLLHGSLYQQKSYNSTDDEVAFQTIDYEIVTQRQLLGESEKVDLYGFYIQHKQESNILYSKEIGTSDSNAEVQRKVEYEYDSATGLLKKQTTYNYNSLGEEEILTQTSVYGWEKYEELKQQNILTPVVETTNKTNDQITAIAVSTWKDWGGNKWGLYRSYQGLNKDAIFDQWNNQIEPPTTDWLQVSEVVSRTSNGVAQDVIDVNGVHSSTLLDNQQFYPIAQFSNATIEEATYTGFEAYENLSDWSVNQGNITDLIVTGDAHTGFSSLQLKPNLTLTKQTVLAITNNKQIYLISAWIKTETGFTTDGGKAELKLQFYNDNNPVGQAITVSIESTDSEWQYWNYAIDPNQIQGTQLGLEISNQKASKSFLVDDICFVPLMGAFQGNVYEPKYKLVSAQLGNGSDTVRNFYDSFQRKVAEIGLGETVNGVTTSYLTRQGNEQENYVFPQDKPNSVLGIAAAEGGVYANFINGEQWKQEWQPTPNPSEEGNNWKVENNALVHTGNTSDSISYQSTASFSNYGVRLSVNPSDTPQQPLGISIGDQLTVTWTQNQGWTLTLNGTSSQVANTGSIPHEWLLVAANNTLLFYADGQQIFAQTIDNNITGALEIFTADQVSFSNIVTFKNPQIGITYSDGAGKERQTQALEGSNCLVTATVYDVLDREAIATKTAQFNNTLFGYRTEFVDINWETGVMTGEVANYYPEDQGYPYSRTVYEPSPLSRPIEQGIPGKAFAIGNGNTHIVTSEYGTNVQGFFAEDSYPSGQYFVDKVTDADGTPVYTLKDKLGNTLAQKAGPITAGSDVYQTTRSIYDAAGNVVKVLLPNQFVPPEGSQPDAWEITMEYDFLGQMTSQTNPDSGTTKYIYDKAGQPRFMVDAQGLTSNPNTILYRKYDVIGRLIEEGWFTGDWGDGSTLQEKADTNPNYPEDGNGRKRYIFDGDGSNPYLIGRLWQVLSSNQGDGNSDVEEVYDYDELGNVASKTLTVTGYAAQTVRYEYDNLGNVIKIHYPDNSNGIPEVVYSYNSLGETVAVGTPENTQRFASYNYNADGSLATTHLNNRGIENSLNYNPPGWPTHIKNEKTDNSLVIEQSLAYTEDGYQGSGYYNGNIAKNSINYGTWDNAPPNYDYQYQYDQLGQLKVAQNQQNEQASLGVGQPTTYDLNGNIETLKRGETTNQYEYIENTDKVNTVSNSSEPQNYGYDANGNVKSASHRQISHIDYDPLTQLTTKVQLEGQTSVSFKYDGGNQRVLKTSQDSSGNQTASKLYVHGLNDYPLLEISEQPVQYIYGLGGLVALVKDGKVYTILKDHLGSTRVVVDEAGKVIAAFDYLPFGDMMGTAYGNPEIISYRYTGQEFDTELGLYNYRARFYDPNLGRFYATDPKAQFASPYLYGGNNPILFYDPSGMWSWGAFGAIVGGVAAIAGGIALTILTAGASTPILVGATIAGGALIGGGAGSAIYGATHTSNFNAGEWGVYTGLGAVFGAIGGGVGLATSGLSTGAALAAETVGGTVLGSLDGFVTNGAINAIHGNSFMSGAGTAAVYGALFGGIGGAIGGLLGRGGAIKNSRILRENADMMDVGVGLVNKNHMFSHSTIRINSMSSAVEQVITDELESNVALIPKLGRNNLSTSMGTFDNFNPAMGREINLRVPNNRAVKGLTLINQRRSQGLPSYNLFTNSCTSNVVDVVSKMGFQVPLYARTPTTFHLWWRGMSFMAP